MTDSPILKVLQPVVAFVPLGGTILSGIHVLAPLASTLLLADGSVTETLGGNSGWVGTGLLGAVLSWLMFVRLPAQDKMMMSMFQEMRQMAKENQEHCDKEIERILAIKFGEEKRGG